MRALRQWSVRHASILKRLYDALARLASPLQSLARRVGAARAERLILPIERASKRLMFDCKMCGQCVLAFTGMSCPTNCAK